MDDENAKFETSQNTSQPLIIGNLNAGELLSSAVGGLINNVLIPTNTMGLPSTVNNNQVIGILPVFIQGPPILPNKDIQQNVGQLHSAPEINVSNNYEMGMDKGNPQFTLSQSEGDNSYRDQQLRLTSSDTLILTSSSGNFSGSTVPFLISSADAKSQSTSILSQQNSRALQTTFSLVSDISNRSINLENIPTAGLFKPEPRDEINLANNSLLISETDITSGIRPSLHIDQLQTSFGNKMAPRTPQTRSRSKKNANHMSNLQQPEMDKCVSKNTSVGSQEVIKQGGNGKKGRFRRDDTIILPSSIQLEESQTKLSLASSDTVVLPPEGSQTVTLPSTMLNSTVFPLETYSSGSLNMSLSVVDNSQVPSPSLSTIPTLMLTNSVVEGSVNPSLLYDLISQSSQNAEPPPIKYLTLDQLFSNANSNILTSLQKTLQGSFLPQSSENIPANVAAKSTQTDWVLGNSVVSFKTRKLSEESKESGMERLEGNIPSSLLLEESLINTAPPFVVEDQGIPSSVLTLVPQDQPILPTESAVPDSIRDKPNEMCLEETDNSSNFQCSICKKGFLSKRDLQHHEKSHPKILKCDLCSSTFTRMGNYTRHRKIHDLKPENGNIFSCSHCGRQFLQRCDLKRHMLIHTKQEPYGCDKCGKRYIRRSDLVVHLRFHNKEKIFNCNLCEKSFFQSGDLNRHVRRAHKPDTQLTCGHCDRKYACEATLIRHMKVVHKDIIVNTVNQTQ